MKYKRLDSEAWQEMRSIVLARDKYCCAVCGTNIQRVGAAHIHHILPLSCGGTNAAANLLSLCVLCHAAHHPNQGMVWNLQHYFKGLCYRLARLCDKEDILPQQGNFDIFLRIFGKNKLRPAQLPLILAALKGSLFCASVRQDQEKACASSCPL